MTAPELRQEIVEAMKSVAWCDDHAKRLQAVETEADNVMDAVERHAAVLSVEELTTAWNAMVYCCDTFDDGLPKDENEWAELDQLVALKNRIKNQIDAQQGSQEADE